MKLKNKNEIGYFRICFLLFLWRFVQIEAEGPYFSNQKLFTSLTSFFLILLPLKDPLSKNSPKVWFCWQHSYSQKGGKLTVKNFWGVKNFWFEKYGPSASFFTKNHKTKSSKTLFFLEKLKISLKFPKKSIFTKFWILCQKKGHFLA